MSKLRIKDAPLLPNVDGSEKIPTGGRGDYTVSVDQIKTFARGGIPQQIEDHINDAENPHQVNKSQVGLGEVDNTSDVDKPISTATQEALDLKANQSTTYTKTEVDGSLGLKADKTYVDSRDLLKADKTYVDSALTGFSNGAAKFYPTLAAANADIANIALKDKVEVGEVANGGTWYKATAGATTLTKSAYDPFVQSKNYTDEAVKTSVNITLTNAGLTLSQDQLKSRMINFIGALSNAIDVTFPEITGQWNIRNGTSGAQVITLKCGTFTVVLPVGQTIHVYKPSNTLLVRTDGDKAPLLAPAFAGKPTVPTAPTGTRDLQAASTNFAALVAHGGLVITVTDDIMLTTVQAGVKTLSFTGTLTKDITVTVPFPTGDWNVRNATSGGFNIRFKSANPPVAIIPASENRRCFANASSMQMQPVGIQTIPLASGVTAGLVKVGNGLNVDAQGLISVESGGGVETSNRTISVLNTTTVAGVATPSARQLSDDGMISFGIESRYLKISFDWGKTWPAGSIYDSGAGTVINWVHETDDGQLLCVVRTTATNNQALYKSTNWQRKNQALTWVKFHEIEKPGVSLNGYWGFSKYRNIMLCAEYGAKVGVQTQNMPPEGAEVGMNARYVYMSRDSGETWTTIFDVNAVTDGVGVHIHGVAFDEFWNRIWVSHGDGFLGTNGLFYSDDFGATWTSAIETHNKGSNFSQTVHIVPLKTCILFASDSHPNGIHRIDRSLGKNPTKGWYDIDTTAYLLENQLEQLNYLCHSVSQPKFLPDLPVTFAFGAETQTGYSQVVATFDGWTFFQLWKDPVISAVGQGARSVIGPTYENEIIIHCTNTDRTNPWERTTLKVAVE